MIALACDHAALEFKEEIKLFLKARGVEYKDFGTDSAESCHYPIYAVRAAKAVSNGECDRGIVICGTGIGMSIAANKVKGIRCSLCNDPYSAQMTRAHNDSNVLALGARVIGIELAKMIVAVWLDTPFEGGRHQTRIDMISDIENDQPLE